MCLCERLCVYIPGGADGGDGGGSQGDAVQPTLLQQRCIMIGVLRLKTHTHSFIFSLFHDYFFFFLHIKLLFDTVVFYLYPYNN